jgi:hypothetical protein
MRSVALDTRSLLAVAEALRRQIDEMEQQLQMLHQDERSDDQRADLLNDLGFLRSLLSVFDHEIERDLGAR